ncbi:MAG: hypothetical protein R3E12_03290 [Candidatus Eisenbacteria bacterium]
MKRGERDMVRAERAFVPDLGDAVHGVARGKDEIARGDHDAPSSVEVTHDQGRLFVACSRRNERMIR